ncbi:(2Fe-2S)-binding protein [Natrinema gelatinilyticum]|uniref:(2Fe-2S)-binding protein n=1 Tax=Natrinema gelatinilyticum TaxID=2961571 RepID=UPI0024145913|nr:(2Fe-2S)-binding protein [Natrinema gelatinilyticum]
MMLNERVTIEVTINGTEYEDTIPARTLLSEYLREHRYLTGTHRGCETAKCGACTVLLDGDAVKSCNMLAVQIDGRELTTIEGLADGDDLHPVQQSFWDEHGMQCGYCTPGMVLSSVALLEENPDPTVNEVREHIAGNICRCTGYAKIVESVMDAADSMEGQYE